MKRTGFLFVIEGPDGVGKSTVSKALVERLKGKRDVVKWTRQPWDENNRQQIFSTPKENWMRHLYLFMKDREEHAKEFLFPYIFQDKRPGHWVITDPIIIQDRYYHSSCVYQGINSNRSCPEEFVEAHLDYANHENSIIIKPDITFILTSPPEVLAQRMTSRNEDKTVFEDIDFLRDVVIEYENIWNSNIPLFDECKLIDANRPVEEIIEDCYKEILYYIDNPPKERPSFFS